MAKLINQKIVASEKTTITIRIETLKKRKWKAICLERGLNMTSLIVDSVEGRLLDNERREIFRFIDTQDNIFAKIENNINQLAKIANAQKFVDSLELKQFNERLKIIENLKREQNAMFGKIYELLGK